MTRSIATFSAAVLTALAVCGGVSGCGGDSSAAPLTKAQFIAQADAICTRTDKSQETSLFAYAKTHKDAMESKAGQEELFREIAIPSLEDEKDQISELGVPKGDEAEIAAMIEGWEKGITTAEDDLLNLTTGSGGPFAKVDELAAKYGFKACSEFL
jgi:hypothetical protein